MALSPSSVARVVVALVLVAAVEASVEASVGASSMGVGLGDVLDTPEWLQEIPRESKLAKYRKRRFVNFPTGSKLDVELKLVVPTEGLSDSGTVALENDLSFNLPNSSNVIFAAGRSLRTNDQRLDLYGRIEKFLTKLGFDGHSCTLRTICEVADMPFEHGLVGEVVNMILKATAGSYNEVDSDPEDEYTMAEYHGRHHGSCFSIYPECPFSITNIISRVVPL